VTDSAFWSGGAANRPYVSYVCLQPRGGGGASDRHVAGLIHALQEAGCKVRLIESRRVCGGVFRRAIWAIGVQCRGMAVMARSDVVWLRMHPMGVVAAAIAMPRKLIVEVNGVPEDYYVNYPALRRVPGLLRRLLVFQLRRASHVIAVTRGLAEQIQELVPGGTVSVLPNAADPVVFRPGLARPRDTPPRYVVFFGALAPWQGLDIALKATRERAWPPDIALLVIGDGPERAMVERAAEDSPGRVKYVGTVLPDRVPAYVSNAEASLVLKQYHDVHAGQSPLKLYESLSAGVPVIAAPLHGLTDVEGLAEFVTVVEPTPEAVAGAIRALCADSRGENASMSVCMRRAILNGHTWRDRVVQILPVLDGRPGL
jgi:glycosyltransferase involved in cell wall biosynthesis